jgi:hypothetical protein
MSALFGVGLSTVEGAAVLGAILFLFFFLVFAEGKKLSFGTPMLANHSLGVNGKSVPLHISGTELSYREKPTG